MSNAPEARVLRLFRKLERKLPVVEPSEGRLCLIANFGVEGDANALPHSPRQVLICFAESLGRFQLMPGDLKENILLAGLSERDLPSGTLVSVGSSRLRITFECEPCKYLKSVGVSRPSILAGSRGTLAHVITSGTIRIEDPVNVEKGKYPSVPSEVPERLSWVLHRVPNGEAIDYFTLLRLAGLPKAYVRALPGLLRSAYRLGAPSGLVVDSGRRTLGRSAEQSSLLLGRGVRVSDGVVDEASLWSGAGLYSDL